MRAGSFGSFHVARGEREGGRGRGVGGGCPAPLGVISGAGRELAVKLVVNTRKTGVNLELYQERERKIYRDRETDTKNEKARKTH